MFTYHTQELELETNVCECILLAPRASVPHSVETEVTMRRPKGDCFRVMQCGSGEGVDFGGSS